VLNLKRITKDLYQKLEKEGLINTTKHNSNTHTSLRRKNKYVCEQALIDYERILEQRRKQKQ
jgi:hypothetical protein